MGDDGTIRCVLLDLDGPILDVQDRYFAAHCDAIKRLSGVRQLSREQYWKCKRTRCSARVILGPDPSEEQLQDYLAAWTARIEDDRLLDLDRLQPDALLALERLRVIPRLVLVTMRSNASGVKRTLARLGLVRRVDHIEIVAHTKGTKVDAFARLGTAHSPASTVVVGDTEVDIEAAHALKFRVVATTNGIRDREELERLSPWWIVDSLEAAARLLLTRDAVSEPNP